MRTDLPACDLVYCLFQLDGNCRAGESRRAACKYAKLPDEPADTPASPWHRVEEELPALKEVLPRYFVSGMCVLYNADTESFDTGFATKLDFGDAEMDWKALYVNNPTHWMPIEPPKEDA